MNARHTKKRIERQKKQGLPPAYQALRPELMQVLEAWNTPADSPAAWTPDKGARERDLAFRVLDAVDGNAVILDKIMRSTGFKAWGWMSGLVLKLFFTGLAVDALVLCERMLALRNDDHLRFTRPLMLARMGRADEALSRIGENLTAYPENPFMLMMAGDAYQILGDRQSAAPLYRMAIDACKTHANADLGMGLARDLEQRLEAVSAKADPSA